MAGLYKRPESVLVVIYSPVGRVLLLERVQPSGFWQSVTGSLDREETADAAARREIAEETGLPVAGLVNTGVINRFTILPQWRSRYAPDVLENTEYVFRLQVAEDLPVRLNPAEHRRYAWLPAAEARQRAFSSTNRAAIEALGLA